MDITFRWTGTCQCGHDREAVGFYSARINKHSIRTYDTNLIAIAPCRHDRTDDGRQCGAHGEEERGHTADIDWERGQLDQASVDAVEEYRRKKGWQT